MNYGLQVKPKRPTDFLLGSSGLDETELNPTGDWLEYLPIKEYQNQDGLELMNCVTMSALNCLETLHNRLYGVEMNWSDRFTAKMSNTTIKGNWLTIVGDSIRKDGLVSETIYPVIWTSWEDYYKEIIQELKDKGLLVLNQYKINYEWVIPSNAEMFENALKIAPIQVCVYAWGNPINGIYRRENRTLNHAVTLIKAVHEEYWVIFDHYDATVKKLAWDYVITNGFKYSLTKIQMKFIKEIGKPDVYLVRDDIAYPISGGVDYLNLENDWSSVTEVDKITQTISDKKLFVFIR